MPDFISFQFPFLAVVLGGYGAGAILSIFLSFFQRRSPGLFLQRTIRIIGLGAALAASVSGCVLAVSLLLTGSELTVALPETLPFGVMTLHADGLSAFFLGTISLLAAIVSVYSFGYVEDLLERRKIGLLLFLYNLFLLSMVCVVLAGHAVFFLLVWEAMSLATYFLITFEHEDPASRRAGFLYVVMTHIGTALLAVMFLLLYASTGSFSFEAFRGAGAHLPTGIQSAAFLCALVGFGTKAGVIPLHIWLPEAHPAAPGNVSALMSGVMIKTGIYGIVRVAFDFLGPVIPEWWGILVLVAAAASAVLGVLYALMEHDIKRLLAFHSIENIGIILMGVGGGLLFLSLGDKPLAALALLAGLYHVLNHATFKGLLFLGAGSLVHGSKTRNIEELGGLIRRLPWTAFFFLIGAAAISALPPLNGFISEWLTFQALLLGFHAPGLAVKIVIPLTVALLALTGALAAACFVKAFGISFLGQPRSKEAAQAHESSRWMVAPMGVLALLCLVFGVAPGLVTSVLSPVTAGLTGVSRSFIFPMVDGVLLTPAEGAATISPAVLALLLAGVMAVPVLVGAWFGGRLRRRTAMTWACGLEALEPRMQYTATGFSKPIRMIFSNIFRATHEIEISEETSPYFHPQIKFELKTESLFLKYFYQPLNAFILRAARRLLKLQTGHIQYYLAYIFLTLIFLLLFAR